MFIKFIYRDSVYDHKGLVANVNNREKGLFDVIITVMHLKKQNRTKLNQLNPTLKY